MNSSVLFFVQNNYSNGGDYTVNVSASSTNISDWQKFNIKFGARAYLINKLYSNASYYTFEFIGRNDINQTIYNVSWNCTLISSSLTINLSGLSNISDYLAVQYNLPGSQAFSCTINSSDGNESISKSLQINGLTINDYDILSRNVSSKVVSYNVKNEFNSTTTNISMLVENTTSWKQANLSTNEAILVFAQVNYSTDGLQSFSTIASAFNQTQNYTEVYMYRGASVDNYQRVSTSNLTQIYLFDVKNNWLNGTISWNISDPNITNSTVLDNNQSLLVFIQTNYPAGTKKPVVQTQRASYVDSVKEQFNIEPIQINSLSTLVENSTGAISELNVQNNLNSTQQFNWKLDATQQNITGNQSVNLSGSNLLVYIATNYSAQGVYRNTATINSSTYTDTRLGVAVIS